MTGWWSRSRGKVGQFVSVVLPVFLVVGAGYVAAWKWFDDRAVDALMRFAQGFAAPVLLFQSIARIDLNTQFDLALLLAFYSGAFGAFFIAWGGARWLFHRSPEDAVAIGFVALFSNSLLLGVPITERAYGSEALAGNWIIIATHSPILYTFGITFMEFTRASGQRLPIGRVALRALIGVVRTPLVIGILCGFAMNFAMMLGFVLPEAVWSAVGMIAATALPTALFALGGILLRYRPEGDAGVILLCCGASLLLHPAITYLMGTGLGVQLSGMRSAVMTAAMAPGVNAYIFAHMYGSAQRVAASSVLLGTGLTVLTTGLWLMLLG